MKQLSIRQQILLMSLIPFIGVLAFVGFYVYYNHIQEINGYFERQSQSHTYLLTLYASENLRQGRQDRLQQLVNAALEAPGVRSVRILDSDQQPLAHAGPLFQSLLSSEKMESTRDISQKTSGNILFLRRAIFLANSTNSQISSAQPRQVQGWVDVEYQRDHFAIANFQTFLGSSLAILTGIFIVSMLGSLIARRLQGRVSKLRQGVRAIAQGFYDTHFHLDGKDELQYLANDLNAMKSAMNSTFHELKSNLERTNTDLLETLESLEIQHIELDMARREAVEASQMKSDFLANTSHEIRTPLNSIIGFTNILLKSENDNRKKNYLETVRQSAETLLSIINDILDFSKIDAGKLLLDKIPVNLHELVDESLSSLAPMANQKQLRLAVFVDKNLPSSLMGDPLRLRQIITNLINNAIKFTASGSICCRIKLISLETGKAHVTIEIEDTGIGLSPEQQQRVFTAFSQADASTSREYGGTGLGLVIVKRLVEQMGGDCGVNSQQGQGSTFWVSLSLPTEEQAQASDHPQLLKGRRVALYDANELTRNAHSSLLESWGMQVTACNSSSTLANTVNSVDISIICLDYQETWPSNFDTRECPCIFLAPEPEILPLPQQACCLSLPYAHLRLFDFICDNLSGQAPQLLQRLLPPLFAGNINTLIVDDNATNRKMLSLLLEDLGIQASCASSGKRAIELCKDHQFDVIFMDLQMPQMDGIQTTRELRKSGLSQQARIFALSAYPSPDDPAALRQAGFDQFFSKPISSGDLHRIFAELAEKVTDGSTLSRPVDCQGCLNLAQGKPDLAQQMLEMLLDSLPQTCQQLEGAALDKKREQLHDAVHQLCGACSYVSVPALKHQAERLLKQLQSNADWPDLKSDTEAIISSARDLLTWREQHDLDTLFDLVKN